MAYDRFQPPAFLSPGTKPHYLKWGLVLLMPFVAFSAGQALVGGDYLLPLLALSILPTVLILERPYMGLVFAWGAFFFLSYDTLRTSIPFLSSPLMVIASLALGLGILRWILSKEPLPPSRLYRPMIIWAFVLIIFAMVGPGTGMARFTRWHLQGMWSFLLVIFTVRKPQQAKMVLWAFLVICIIIGLKELPTALQSQGLAFRSEISYLELRNETSTGTHLPQMLALAWPVLYGLAVFSRIHPFTRFIFGGGAAIILVFVVSSGIGTPFLTLFAAFVSISILQVASQRTKAVRPLVFTGVAILIILLYSAGAQAQFQRIGQSANDQSITTRMKAAQAGLTIFESNPFSINGIWDAKNAPQYAVKFTGHNSFLEIAVGLGLWGLISISLYVCYDWVQPVSTASQRTKRVRQSL